MTLTSGTTDQCRLCLLAILTVPAINAVRFTKYFLAGFFFFVSQFLSSVIIWVFLFFILLTQLALSLLFVFVLFLSSVPSLHS